MSTNEQKHSIPKLLIVDDQAINIRVIHELFRNDYEVYMATSGAQALEKARTLLPDLILLDVVMPGMSGHEVCQHIKADPALTAIPVIFVTAHYDEEDEVRGFELGAVDFIHKPTNPTITRARVRNQLLLKQQTDILRSYAMIDGLTGIANRRKFETYFHRNWLQCKRDQVPLSLFMIDVDYFKKFNDHYGHQAGDNTLQQIATILQQGFNRATDIVARYGGEEFVVILPNTNKTGALAIAHQLQELVGQAAIPHEHNLAAPYVTISIGIAALERAGPADYDLILRQADNALYLAKGAGRNSVA